MATTRVTYSGDGATLAYDIPFTYQTTDDVVATVDGVEAEFTWLTPSRIQLSGAPAVGATILIRRSTDIETPAAVFTNNELLDAKDLNTLATQQTYRHQEARDEVFELEVRTLKVPAGEEAVTLPAEGVRAGKLLGFDAEGNPAAYALTASALEALASIISAISTVAGIAGNVTTVAGIAGAVTTVAGIAGNVTTVAGIAGSVTAVAGNSANINAVAANAANINIVAARSTDIQTVSARDADIGVVASDLNLGASSVMLQAGAAIAAISALAPTYSYKHSVGDRRGIAVISDLGTGAIAGSGASYSTWQQFIDGTLAGGTPTMYFAGGSVAGRILGYFPKAAERAWFVADALRFRFGTSIVNGTWEPIGMRGVEFDADGVPISAAEIVSLGAGVAVTGTLLEIAFTNSTPYEAYGIRGVSGTAAAAGVGTGLWEIEVRARASEGYGRRVLASTAAPGQTVRVNSGGQAVFVDPREPEGRSLLNHLWLCNEGHGRWARDQIGGSDFDLQGGTGRANIGAGGSIAWEDGELVLRNAALSTASNVAARAVFFVYESVVDQAHYACTHVTNNALFHTNIRLPTHAAKLKMLHSLGVNDPVVNGNNGMMGFASGGTSGAWINRASLATGAVILNATRNTDWAGMIASPLRILAIGTMATDPTAAEVQTIQNFFDWHMAERGRVLTGKYAKKRCAVAVWTGESTHHTTLVMDATPGLTEAMRKQHYNTFLMAGMGPIVNGAAPRLQRLSYWMDRTWSGYQLGNESRPGVGVAEDDRNRKMGPLYGFAEKERYADTPNEHPIFHFKLAQGGTLIAPFGSPYAAGGTVALVDTFDAGATTGATLFTAVQCQGWSKFEAELRRQGYGVDYITHYHAPGLNDSTGLAAGVLSAGTFQGWLQTSHDRFKAFVGVSSLPTYVLVPHLPIPGAAETYAAQCGQPGVTDYPNTAAGHVQLDNLLLIRADVRAFDTANADVTAVEADLYGTNIANGDSVHMPLAGLLSYGGDCRRRFAFTSKVTWRYDV